MTKTKLESISERTSDDPLSYPELNLVPASTTVTVVVAEDFSADNFSELLIGAAESTRLLGLDELHIIAPAVHLPSLAVAAADIAHLLPEKFQFCEAETCTHLHPDDDTYLTAESVAQLGTKLKSA
ncbi:hypothetical protein N24_0245 [Corynebacterium suranareeae]|uniref:Uncharacterized protein n=1 Tax=Corynebacterium suranareeae TaxID=2506452 RepID=A0A160PLB6_9CORY|nr:hypothetical protein [Corynebacterium suranareeae]BAU94507.1 hypothetical protein N24_0245 [Corynebacterium suranareeae]